MITTEIDEYVRAYTELNCLLEYLPKNYYSKIPPKFIELIKLKSNDKYKIVVNPEKNLNEHNISRKTKVLLAILKYNYWCTDNAECEKLKKIFSQNEINYQEKMKEKYNVDNIFKNTKSNIQNNEKEEVTLVEVKKEKWYQKFILFMKKILRRKKF